VEEVCSGVELAAVEIRHIFHDLQTQNVVEPGETKGKKRTLLYDDEWQKSDLESISNCKVKTTQSL
jgi:hypothetical protein